MQDAQSTQKDSANEASEAASSTASATSTTYLLLIRHGQNDWVGSHRLAGRTPGVHLNDRGREQAQQVAHSLQHQPIAAVYSSPMERCMETAQPLADALGLKVQPEAGVLEIDFGEWQGQSLKDLSKLPAWRMVQYHPSSFRFPSGETLREAQDRAVRTMERLADLHPNQTVAIFSHCDLIRTLVAHYVGTPLDLFQRIAIDTASLSVIALSNGRPAVLLINQQTELPRFEVKQAEEQREESKTD